MLDFSSDLMYSSKQMFYKKATEWTSENADPLNDIDTVAKSMLSDTGLSKEHAALFLASLALQRNNPILAEDMMQEFYKHHRFSYVFSEVKWEQRGYELARKFERFIQTINFGHDSAMEICLDE